MVSNHDRAAILLQMVAEAVRDDVLNVETVTHALDHHLTIYQLLQIRLGSEMISACYLKLLAEKTALND